MRLIIGFLCIGLLMVVPAAAQTRTPRAKQSAQVTYSCPMHPEVTKKSKGKCPKCVMALRRM